MTPLNIKNSLDDLLPTFNNRKPVIFAEIARKDFHASFVREGQARKLPKTAPRRGLLDYANDWKMLVDFKHDPIVFPPMICSTSERPDIVIWSPLCRTVILLELTCPAEEGIAAAQRRKEARYQELLEQINSVESTPIDH